MKNFARKAIVALIGFPLIIIGVLLIPLPGPGLLVILAGLFVLAIEFEWAKRHKHRIKRHLKKLRNKSNKNT